MTTDRTGSLVLYVDDDPDDIEVVKEIFEMYQGIELLCFSDSPAFIKYIIGLKPFTRRPFLVMLDINMPVLDGKEVLTILRAYKELKNVPIALFTTSNNPQEIKFAKNLDALFTTKPATRKQLFDAIAQLVKYCDEKNDQ